MYGPVDRSHFQSRPFSSCLIDIIRTESLANSVIYMVSKFNFEEIKCLQISRPTQLLQNLLISCDVPKSRIYCSVFQKETQIVHTVSWRRRKNGCIYQTPFDLLRRILINQCGQTGQRSSEILSLSFYLLPPTCQFWPPDVWHSAQFVTVWHNAVYPLKLAFFHLSACEPLLQGLTVQKNHIQPSSALTFKFDQTRAIFQRVAPVDLKRKLLVSTKHFSYQNIKRHIHTQTF